MIYMLPSPPPLAQILQSVDMIFYIFNLFYDLKYRDLHYYNYPIDINPCMSDNLFIVSCNAFDGQL